MWLTARQFFQQHIYGKIDQKVKIEEVISASAPSITFRVCNPKWMRVGSKFVDIRSDEWTVTSIDYTTNVVGATCEATVATLNRLETIVIDKPLFKSGTPLNLNKEEALALNNNVKASEMLIWLLETISGVDALKQENGGSDFDYTFYILFKIDAIENTNNEDRHNIGVIQATQVRQELKRIMDETNGIFRLTAINFKEFNYFGRETSNGIEQFILNSNLSGIECRVSVRSTRKLLCKC